LARISAEIASHTLLTRAELRKCRQLERKFCTNDTSTQLNQSLKKIAILRGAIFAQISPFRAKSQFFANALSRNFCANLRPRKAQFSHSSQILQFARRYLRFPAKVRIFYVGLARN